MGSLFSLLILWKNDRVHTEKDRTLFVIIYLRRWGFLSIVPVIA